jgi:hypothetical protein
MAGFWHFLMYTKENAMAYQEKCFQNITLLGLVLTILLTGNARGNPAGSEFQVNTYTNFNQEYPEVAMDDFGNFVVVWQSEWQDGDMMGIYAQRYNAAGEVQGGEFKVNTYTTSHQISPSVSMNAAGNFVITWQSARLDGYDWDIYAQRYNAAGMPQGDEFLVNSYRTFTQTCPSVVMDNTGNFVIAWESCGQDGDGDGIYAQRYNAAGISQGSEFLVNTYTTGYQSMPSLGMDKVGNFVITWQGAWQDDFWGGISAQLYNAAGVSQGSEFKVNSCTKYSQYRPSVAMDATGNFVIVWESEQQDGDSSGIYAQRYNAAGVAQGGEFLVNTYTTDMQQRPKAAMDNKGNFIIVWMSNGQDGDLYGVYAKRYNAAGEAQSDEFLVNTYTKSSQSYPSITMSGAGNLIISWRSYEQDSEGWGVFAQRYEVTQPAADTITAVQVDQ